MCAKEDDQVSVLRNKLYSIPYLFAITVGVAVLWNGGERSELFSPQRK